MSAPRVVLLDGPAAPRLAASLTEAGEPVTVAGSPAELARILNVSPVDVIVLDLSDGKKAQREAIDPRGAFVLALTRDGKAPAHAPARPDVCVPVKDLERAVREVRGAAAIRRLSEATLELEQLRIAVTHARRTAHDLAQPLTTILARAQLLAGKLAPGDPSARAVGIICEESERLARLVEEFQKLRELTRRPGLPADQAGQT
ncbi:MAG: histidine kinase dimerization/phospho-acceptor domain-containing protein [Candidatus Polarisedimenticolia bacterium]